MNRVHWVLTAVLLAAVLGNAGGLNVSAQTVEENELTLRLTRTFGYGLGGQVQGTFTLVADGPADLKRVEFLIDDRLIGVDEERPFHLKFNTSDYAEGLHRMSAIGFTTAGEEVRSATITRQFVAADSTVLVVIGLVILVLAFRVASYLLARRKLKGSGRPTSYGFLGGAICPNCGRAFGLHWWSLRLGFSRVDRCPHCRKWNMVQRSTLEALEAAEKLLGPRRDAAGKSDQAEQGDDALQRRLEESRYDRR